MGVAVETDSHAMTAMCHLYINNKLMGRMCPSNRDQVAIKLITLLKPTGYVMHQQFNIQQLYVRPTLYLCVLYLSENKQRLVPLTA
jgi:hypothetical protein